MHCALTLIFLFAVLGPSCFGAANDLEWIRDPNGLKSLRYHGSEFLARGNLMVNAAQAVDSSGKSSTLSLHPVANKIPEQHSSTLTFEWGTIGTQYRVDGSTLAIKIAVANTSRFTVKSLSLDVLALRLPSTPLEYDGKQPMLGTNVGAPTLLPLNYNRGSILVVNDDVNRPLLLGMPWSLNAPSKTIFPLRINTGRDPMYPDSLPYIDRPVPPGGKDEFDISLRFSSSHSDLQTSLGTLFRQFTHLNEFTLHWPDRRPIGSLILATAATGWSTNPRGWLLDPTISVQTASGLTEFHARVLAWADHSIGILRKMNAQGMITWDIEGEQFPHPTTYVGDPSASQKTAPEMAAVIDDYFLRFRKAGLRVGVTIRPQKFELSGDAAMQTESDDPAAQLIRKISYAKKRWGATLFYIDSNGDAVRPLASDVFVKVAKAFPDVLLIPEHKNVTYYATTAPYSEAAKGHYATPELTAAIYPRSFSIINTADGDVNKHFDELLAAINRGDILMFRSWFDDPSNATIRAIYARSHPGER